MQIKIKTLTGKEVSPLSALGLLSDDAAASSSTLPHSLIEMDVEPSHTTQKIKEQLEEKEGIPPAQQRLIYLGKNMPEDKTVTELKVEAGSTIHLVLSLRGGRSC
ncbi:hypothetical protein BMF94_2035 [Rhodotorula taiwanensis]|uniref:Ubiquitin-like domain-containing protein n=1 Tax=Rhodotorula taiwanensis TaxID=741276 RepID=A0A2S5BE70_9BASI|nr:hypothetical protein BMF94_2035 [Rhodotorula taiwanensis]